MWRTAWAWRRWWCPPAAVVWLLPAGLVELRRGEVPGAIRVVVALAVVAAMAWWWPPLGGAARLLFLGGNQGGTREKKKSDQEGGAATARTTPSRVELLSLGGEPKPRRWAVSELVPFGPYPKWCLGLCWPPVWREERGYVTAVLGSGGTGKSYLLLSLGMALLTGGEWLGRAVLRCRSVLYVDAELDSDTQRERAYQVARGFGLARPPGPAHWWQVPLDWIRPWGLHYYRPPVSVGTTEGLELVGKQVRRTRAEFVLFDSLTIGAAGTALSDQNGWNGVLSGMERWGKPVGIIDHMGKSRGGGMVGSFMKQAKVRSAVQLERNDDGTVDVEHVKANFGPILPAFTMRPVFDHCTADDPAPGVVRFDVVPTTSSSSSSAVSAVLAAFAERGATGATLNEVAEATGTGYQAVRKAALALVKAKALTKAGKATTGGRAGDMFVATGLAPSPSADGDAELERADALLLSALAPSSIEGGVGRQGVSG